MEKHSTSARYTTVEVLRRDAVVRKGWVNAEAKNLGGGRRNIITKFSPASRRRLVQTVRNAPDLGHFLTLTYHLDWPGTGEDCKAHLKLLRQKLQYHYQGITGVWFLEFQRRGAPHFHFFVDQAVDQDKLRSWWNAIVDPGNDLHLKHGAYAQPFHKKEGAAIYASKYGAKMEQKEVPVEFAKVGRFWGFFGNRPKAEQASLTYKEVVKLTRIARAADKANRRDWGGPKRRYGSGRSGFSSYDSALAIRYYLQRIGTVPDDPSRPPLILHWMHSQSV